MLNFGHLIASAHQLLAEAYVQGKPTVLLEGEAAYRGFLAEVNASPGLRREYLVYHNLQRQGLAPELAREYVEANLRQLDGLSAPLLREGHERMRRFARPGTQTPTLLESAIHVLVQETLAPAGTRRVHAYYDALRVVTESLSQPVPHTTETAGPEDAYTLPQVLNAAIGPLSENLGQLNESDRHVVFVLGGTDEAPKKALFEAYHRQAGALLAEHADADAQARLQAMYYQPETVNQEILDLHALLHEH